MSTFKQKKELKAQIAAAKAAGKSTQTIGRLQYKLNQLTASPKGNAVKKKSGAVVKTKSGGTVRTKPTSTVAKKRPVAKRKKPLVGHPSGGTAPKKKLGLGIEFITKPTPHVQRLQRGSPSAERLSFVNDKAASIKTVEKTPPKITMQALRKYTDAQLKTLAKKGVKGAATLLNLRLSTAPKRSRDNLRKRR